MSTNPLYPNLPFPPQRSVPLGSSALLSEGPDGGAVFIGPQATYAWTADDEFMRRLAAIQCIELDLASDQQIAAAFRTDRTSLWRWRTARQRGGWESVVQTTKRGPKRASKLTCETVERVRLLYQEGGHTQEEIAREVGVSLRSIARALKDTPRPPRARSRRHAKPEVKPQVADESQAESDLGSEELPAVPAPVPRQEERRLARAGQLQEAPPVFTQGRELPLLGLLLALPTLAETGFMQAAEQIYSGLSNGFYGLRSMLLTLCMLTLLREPRAEGATRISPTDLGRVLALDRAPEVKTIRRRFSELAARGQEPAAQLLKQLAEHHVEVRSETLGFLYIDGHVNVYTGKRRLPKAHVSRLRISAPAAEDLWLCDPQGDPVFVVQQPPGSSMVKEMRALLPELKKLAQGRRVTICFDRGGWSPKLFKDILEAGFHFITYQKVGGEKGDAPLPTDDFEEVTAKVSGREQTFFLAERAIAIVVNHGKDHRSVLPLRQVVRLKGDHQTMIVTSRTDLPRLEVAVRMFSRWRQENWFKYARTHFALDALDSYHVISDDRERRVPNPARRRLKQELTQATNALLKLEAQNAELGLPPAKRLPLEAELRAARARVHELESDVARLPTKLRLGDVEPDAKLLAPERRMLAHAVRMSVFNAESALARLLAPGYSRGDDEARSLLREAFRGGGDLRVVDDRWLEVRLNPMSAPRRTAALAFLCDLLNQTETTYPGTRLLLRYSVKQPA